MIIFLTILACLLIASLLLIIGYSLKTGVVPMPSLHSEQKTVLSILAEYKGIRTATDLGSGWGGLARRIARGLPDYRVSAVERSLIPHLFSRLLSYTAGGRAVFCIRSNFLKLKLEHEHAYITYLSSPVMKQLRRKFEAEQPRGGILISIAFAMPGWTPVKVVISPNVFHTPVYVYEY